MDRLTELCPNCGHFVSVLREDTGWCIDCSGGEGFCLSCGRPYNGDRTTCPWCRYCNWLESNADKIEVYLAYGDDFQTAKAKVQHDNKPKCLNCGDEIGQAPLAFFCKKPACRKAFNRYRYRRFKLGLTVEDALREAV